MTAQTVPSAIRALYIPPSADPIEVSPVTPSYPEIPQAIGAQYFETVALRALPGLALLVDEEGLWNDKKPNDRASTLASRLIVGDALVVRVDGEEFVDLDDHDLTLLSVLSL